MLTGLKLPFRFDTAALQRDLALLNPEEWSPHYNERDFGGEWQGVALRSVAGPGRDLHAGNPGESEFHDTDLLARCAYFAEVLSAFECPLKSVRLLSLAPGSFIREHSDRALAFEEGEIRLHIPIRTNPDVEFYVCGERLLLEEGQCYYVNVNLPHRVNNRGSSARVHLVIDASVDDWVRALFAHVTAQGGEIPRSARPPRGFSEFADMVFADEALREKLRAISNRGQLLRQTVQEAAGLGFELNEADIEAARRSERVSPGRDTDGWMPIRISLRETEPWATWIYTGGHRFTAPFFESDVRTRLCQPFTELFRREAPLREGRTVRPDGFIFHLSRCGSTLISRSLAEVETMHVLSEPAPVDELLRIPGGADRLEWLVSALGRAAAPRQTRYVLKLDSWHIRDLPLFRAAFPETPWIFVYRDPLEVLVSHLHKPGLHTSPGAMDPAILGLRFEDITGLTRQQWIVRVLEGFLRAALSYRDDPAAMFVDYGELPAAIRGKIARHFNLGLSAGEVALVEAAARLDAKYPFADFVSDHEAKKDRMEKLAPAGLETLRDLYRELSRCRGAASAATR